MTSINARRRQHQAEAVYRGALNTLGVFRNHYNAQKTEASSFYNKLLQGRKELNLRDKGLKELFNSIESKGRDYENVANELSEKDREALLLQKKGKTKLNKADDALRTAFEEKEPYENLLERLNAMPKDFEANFSKAMEAKQKLEGRDIEAEGLQEELEKYKELIKDLPEQREALAPNLETLFSETKQKRENLDLLTNKANKNIKKAGGYQKRSEPLLSDIERFIEKQKVIEEERKGLGADFERKKEEREGFKKQLFPVEEGYKKASETAEEYRSAIKNLANRINSRHVPELKEASRAYAYRQNAVGNMIALASLPLSIGAAFATGGLSTSLTAGALAAGTAGGMYKDYAATNYQDDMSGIDTADSETESLDSVPTINKKMKQRLITSLANKNNLENLGGLKQALEHFKLKTMPEYKELPDLNKTLGGARSSASLKDLILGLPRMMSAGKGKEGLNARLLMHPMFRKKLKGLSKLYHKGGNNFQYA